MPKASREMKQHQHSIYKFQIIVVIFLMVFSSNGNPLKDSQEILESEKNDSLNKEEAEESIFGDGDDLIGELFEDILKGFEALIAAKFDLFSNITNGGEFDEKIVEKSINVGLEATEEATRIGVKAIGYAPQILKHKLDFIFGLQKTFSDTNDLVKASLNQTFEQVGIASALAKTYGEFALENIQNFKTIFQKRLKCNTECESLELNSSQREACEKENCVDVEEEVTENPDDRDDIFNEVVTNKNVE